MRERSNSFVVVFLLFFLVYTSAIIHLFAKPIVPTPHTPIQISIDNDLFTPYPISLTAMASANNLPINMVDPDIIRADPAGAFEFVSLKWVDGITVSDLAAMLLDSGVLTGHEQDFLDAAKKYNINPVYLVAHARLETGNGTSNLAKGIFVSAGFHKDSYNHQYNIPVSGVYYNFFGIRAYDGNAANDGSLYAASQNWNSVRAAIMGGAEWISGNYINRSQVKTGSKSYDQDTLYQMRFDPYGWAVRGAGNRYATDQKWAHSIAGIMQRYEDVFNDVDFEYDIPQYITQ